jgi:hypothetical protein
MTLSLTWGVCNMNRAFKYTQNGLKIDSVDQKLFKFQLTDCGNFSQGAGTPGTEIDIGVFTAGGENVKRRKFSCLILLA